MTNENVRASNQYMANILDESEIIACGLMNLLFESLKTHQLKILFYKHDGMYYAEAIDIGQTGTGRSFEEASEDLKEIVVWYSNNYFSSPSFQFKSKSSPGYFFTKFNEFMLNHPSSIAYKDYVKQDAFQLPDMTQRMKEQTIDLVMS